MYHDLIRNEFFESIKLMQIFSSDDRLVQSIEDASRVIVSVFKNGGKVLSCGNGGSHCNAMHFSEELTGRYRQARPGYPAIVISDPSYFSCVSNDFGYEYVFSRYLESVGTNRDVLLSISTSGQSINILNAINAAYNMGMQVISLTGNKYKSEDHDNSRYDNTIDLKSNAISVEISVPYSEYSDRIQDVHIKIIHILILLIEKEMLK
ncbi:D-sedoheptulose 7-phosphate isomerase [Blochmannia endosymbiont of Polyrhachis (Hedomyrma) turneri]|uniref:D-sedoheptulose 7-phosphate isomerase n=1 Tax=Blochmannia endosymbiont of Polyrhachis (Hedomyrma) turneri TaxID=1505596 RepID=UPI00061A79F7|nr:D-sedoheptulose 7-phosphate isomerase [Blochmannia endosymbiont of Polyrhachis (Hedomyrma) turneri]AKC59802.1 phosphoheptose isomerase [Blochmannia endosymbiont of Polyrhachis (Hedomyrma) turneri]